ncbi:MAG: flippase-like domain-containing protein, partial [Planctomycetales bacterium]|nr:flippase-like domain-containing protein [Planctomycetales bacterium]
MSETPKFEIRPAHWLFGLLMLIGVIIVSRHFMDVGALVESLRHANPFWLLAAAGLQFCTYMSASMVLSCPLRYHGQPQTLLNLLPLSLAKQFISQAVPSVGMSGTLFVIHGLEKRSVSRGVATHSVLIGLLGHYLAFATAVLVTLGIFWQLRELTNAILVPASIFFVLIALVSLAVFWFGERAKQVLPGWLLRLPVVGGALTAYQETVTSSSLWFPLLVSQTAIFTFLILVVVGSAPFLL